MADQIFAIFTARFVIRAKRSTTSDLIELKAKKRSYFIDQCYLFSENNCA